MKTLFLVAFLLLSIVSGLADEPVLPPEVTSTPAEVEEVEEYNDSVFGVAVTLAESLSTTTGIAMTPLLGMGLLGVWEYFQAEGALRDSLPWYAQPWSWGICIGIFCLLKSKDILGAWIPEMVKKPITVVDDVQEKASALIVGLAVIPPAVYEEFRNINPGGIFGQGETTMALAPVIFPVLVVIVSVVVFAVVWLAFNAFSSIKVLSPSSVINTGISVVKGGILAFYGLILALNPFVALAMAVGLIIFSVAIAGWAFRWNVFGVLFAKDFLFGSPVHPIAEDEPLKGFASSHYPDVPSRSYGEIHREGNQLIFSWNPWLIGPRQKQSIEIVSGENSLRKGVFLPSVTVKDRESDRYRSVFDFRMKYRGKHDELRDRLNLAGVSPNLVTSGIRAGWEWLNDQLRQDPVEQT